jgi:hypothetical protein
MNDYIRISKMPTCIISGHGYHESVLRAYNILNKVKLLLQNNTNTEIVLELIDLMENSGDSNE